MPTIKEILQEERNRENVRIVLFLEGKFWKSYERSAFALTQRFGFKPSKRYIKLVEEEIISVGFPKEQLFKYLRNAMVESDGKSEASAISEAYKDVARIIGTQLSKLIQQ